MPSPAARHSMMEGQTRTLQASQQMDWAEVEQSRVPSTITSLPPFLPSSSSLGSSETNKGADQIYRLAQTLSNCVALTQI